MNDMAPDRLHNRPPSAVDPDAYADFEARVRDFADAAGAWLDLREIRDEEQAGKLKDFIDGARALWKQIDDGRKRDKEPHLTASKAVDDAFKVLLGPIEKAVERTKQLQTAWLVAEKKRRDAAQAEAQRIAREQEAAAEAARRAAAERNDVMGEAEAERAAAEAREAADLAARPARARITSATGGGRATGIKMRRVARITNLNVAFRHVSAEPAVVAAIQAALNTVVRSKEFGAAPYQIPGVEIDEEAYS